MNATLFSQKGLSIGKIARNHQFGIFRTVDSGQFFESRSAGNVVVMDNRDLWLFGV
jgi:hypothetical protein